MSIRNAQPRSPPLAPADLREILANDPRLANLIEPPTGSPPNRRVLMPAGAASANESSRTVLELCSEDRFGEYE
jgi:hypothetical protein